VCQVGRLPRAYSPVEHVSCPTDPLLPPLQPNFIL